MKIWRRIQSNYGFHLEECSLNDFIIESTDDGSIVSDHNGNTYKIDHSFVQENELIIIIY